MRNTTTTPDANTPSSDGEFQAMIAAGRNGRREMKRKRYLD